MNISLYIKQYALLALIIGIFVAAEVGAGVWSEPGTTNPPTSSVSIPVHAGLDQVKTGGLSVGTFIANQGASFAQDVYFNGPVRGGTPADPHSQITIGDTTNVVSATINGAVDAFAGLSSGALAHTSQNPVPVCTDNNGTLGFCTIRDYCSNLPGVQSMIPQGMIYKTLNRCVYPPGAAVVGYQHECIAQFPREFAWLTNNERGGFYKLNITLPKAPLANQKLSLRVGSSLPAMSSTLFGQKVRSDAWYIVEGEKTIARYRSTNTDYNNPELIPEGVYTDPFPGNCDRDEQPCFYPWYVMPWYGVPIWQARNYDAPPMVIDIPAGTTKIDVPILGCYRAGKGGKLQWSYIKTIEYKFEKSDPNDHDYTLAAPMAREVKKL